MKLKTLNANEIEIDKWEKYAVARNMVDYGGSFVRPLGEALFHADPENTARLKAAWPEYWQKYLKMEVNKSDQ